MGQGYLEPNVIATFFTLVNLSERKFQRMKICKSIRVVAVTLMCIIPCKGDVFSSSVKMIELGKREGILLDSFKDNAFNYGYHIHSFLESRREVRSITDGEASSHPNGAYLLIKAFVERWNSMIGARNGKYNGRRGSVLTELYRYPLRDAAKNILGYSGGLVGNPQRDILMSRRDLKAKIVTSDTNFDLPTSLDLDGMLAALLRLQRVYNLTASQIYSGNISGFKGPQLTSHDALAIGKRAFMDGMFKQSADWLTVAYNRLAAQTPGVMAGVISHQVSNPREQAQVLGLLGRTVLRLNDRQTATSLYHQSALLGDIEGDVHALGLELSTSDVDYSTTIGYDKDPELDGMHKLCTRDKTQIVGVLRPFHRCRYKPSLHVPYRTYREEILNEAPYASIFHEALTDQECDYIKNLAISGLSRAYLNSDNGTGYKKVDLHTRTAELNWISDEQDPLIRRISRRVMDMTWLEADDRNNSIQASAEMLQVLNYGLGGHFSSHLDPFEDSSPRALNSGLRIATFLFYLETVELGGSTAFINADISVPPVKGKGLFWYNCKSNGNIDPDTKHAGCPVLKGHKWIANKWIWTEGNMYRRPCGSRPNSSQLEVEKITFSRRHNIPFL